MKTKFRAWDNVGKGMLDWWTICQTAFNRTEENTYGLMYRILTNQAAAGENYGFVVMLYTGQNDKKGKEIYAGDILMDQYDDREYSDEINDWKPCVVKLYYPVVFKDGSFGWISELGNFMNFSYNLLEDVEIVGTVYTHHELLTKVK